MAAKRIEIHVDVVQGDTGSKVKATLKGIDDEVRRINKQTEANRKQTDRVIVESAKQRAKAELDIEKSLERSKKSFFKSVEMASRDSARKVQGVFKDVFAGTFLGTSAANAISAGFSRAFSGIQTAFQKSLDFSQMKLSLAQFEGSMERAEERIRILNKAAQETPGLGFLSAIEGQKRLEGIGFAADTATKILTGLAKVRVLSGATKDDFDAVIVNLQQIASGGQRVTQEIREFATRMPALMQVIQNEFGTTGEALNDIDPKVFVARLADAMNKVQADANQTGLAVENLQDAFDRLYIAVGSVIEQNPDLLALIKTLTREIDGNTNALSDNENQTRSTFGSWVSWSARAALAVTNFADRTSSVISAAVEGLAGLVVSHIGVVQGALAGFGNLINKLVIEPINAAKNLLAAFGNVPLVGSSFTGLQGVPDIASIDTRGYQIASDATMYQARRLFGGAGRRLANINVDSNRRNQIFDEEQRSIRQSQRFNRRATIGGIDYDIDPETGTLRVVSPTVANAGGGGLGGSKKGPGRLPKTKSSRTNINLKDEMTDALEIAAKYGLVVTAGRDGKHNPGSAHFTGGAFDVRTNGVHPGIIDAAMRDLQSAGYAVRDERTRPAGQQEWSGAHMHVAGGRSRIRTRRLDEQALARIRDDWMPLGGTPTELLNDEVRGRSDAIAANETVIEQNQKILDVYRQLEDALFDLNDATEEQILLRKMMRGDISTDPALLQLARDLDTARAKKKTEQEALELIERQQDEQKRMLEDVRRGWEDLLYDLANGDFKSIWRRFKDEMLQQFIQPASAYLAKLFGGIGGGGGMGPGGTPMFNPNAGGGGGGFNLGGFFQSIFGGGGGNRTAAAAGTGGGDMALPPGLFGGPGGSTSGGGGSMWGGWNDLKNLGQGLGGSGGAAGGGLSGFLRNLGGGSKMAGLGSGLGAIAMMAGGAIGGKWGNLLSLTGMGAQIGANFGPWGAVIGAGIGAGAGFLSMLFGGGDKSLKKLKEAAAAEFGISVKDKSVLKQLKAIGEQYFGKGQAGANATAVVHTEEGMNVLRAYAEASGQSGLKIDRINYGDENWSGNQLKSKFGGFRRRGGPVAAGNWHIVGEDGPEVFVPSTSGTITPNGGGAADPQMMGVMMGLLDRVATALESFEAISPGEVVQKGAAAARDAIAAANDASRIANPRGAEMGWRAVGAYS